MLPLLGQMEEGEKSGDLQAISKTCALLQIFSKTCLMTMSSLGKKTIVVHILWKNRQIAPSLSASPLLGITCELWSSTDVFTTLLHPRSLGRFVGLCQFSQADGLRTVLLVPPSSCNTHLQAKNSAESSSL